MKCSKTIVKSLVIIALLCGGATTAPAYEVGDWTVVQLTDNETNDAFPQIENGTVVWHGMDANNRRQIFMWQDGVTTQLTDNALGNADPQIGGGLVVWTVGISRVFSYDGEVHELTPSYEQHGQPVASKGNAAWLGEGAGVTRDIYFFDGTEYTQITATNEYEYNVRISGSSLTWTGTGVNGAQEVFFYDGLNVTQVTANSSQTKYPCITDGGPDDFHLTFESYIDGAWDVMHFDGTDIVNLSNTPGVNELGHHSCGNRTVWYSYTGQSNLYLHDGSSVSQVPTNGEAVSETQVSDSLVVWESGYWGDVYVYDGTVYTRLTESGETPKVHGGTVVWHGSDGHDDEIFMAYKTNTGVVSVPESRPLQVYGAQPNPFNPATEIRFASTQSEEIKFRVFDIRGRLVADMGQRVYPAGQHGIKWEGKDAHGQAVPSGVYFYQVESAHDVQSGKVTLIE